MPKHVFCAECGERLEMIPKAVPSQQKIYWVVKPHKCRSSVKLPEEAIEKITEEAKKKPTPNIDQMFDSFKFVKKLNSLKPKPTPLNQETGDKRNKDHLRKELNVSTAPKTVLDNLKVLPNSTPEGDISEDPDE